MRPRYVLIELTVEDWGAVDPAGYVAASIPGFMGDIRAVEIVFNSPLAPFLDVVDEVEWQYELYK